MAASAAFLARNVRTHVRSWTPRSKVRVFSHLVFPYFRGRSPLPCRRRIKASRSSRFRDAGNKNEPGLSLLFFSPSGRTNVGRRRRRRRNSARGRGVVRFLVLQKLDVKATVKTVGQRASTFSLIMRLTSASGTDDRESRRRDSGRSIRGENFGSD